MITYRDLLIKLWNQGNIIMEQQYRNFLEENGIFKSSKGYKKSCAPTEKAIKEGYIIIQDNQTYFTNKVVQLFKGE